MNKTLIFAVFTFAILIAEVLYLSGREFPKNGFVKLTGFSSFAFNNGYFRHIHSGSTGEIYKFHPGFGENESASFINSGLWKIYE